MDGVISATKHGAFQKTADGSNGTGTQQADPNTAGSQAPVPQPVLGSA